MRYHTAATAAAVTIALLSIGTQAAPALQSEPCAKPATLLTGELYESSKALEEWVRAQAVTFDRPALASYEAAFAASQQGLAVENPDAGRLSLDVVVFDEPQTDPFFGSVYTFKSATFFRVVLKRDCGDDWYVASALRTRTEKTPEGSMSPGGAPAVS